VDSFRPAGRCRPTPRPPHGGPHECRPAGGPHECRPAGCPGRFVTGAANPARIMAVGRVQQHRPTGVRDHHRRWLVVVVFGRDEKGHRPRHLLHGRRAEERLQRGLHHPGGHGCGRMRGRPPGHAVDHRVEPAGLLSNGRPGADACLPPGQHPIRPRAGADLHVPAGDVARAPR